MTAGLAALATLIVDAEDEAPARSIAQNFAENARCQPLWMSWEAYPKLGPHSRVSFAFLLPAGGGQIAIDAIEAVAAHAVVREALTEGYLNSFINEDGSFFYNRIFDARTDQFHATGILWLDLEVDTAAGAQASFKQR